MTKWYVDGDGEERERMLSILNDDVYCSWTYVYALITGTCFQIQRHHRLRRRRHHSPRGADIDLKRKYYLKKATRMKTRNVQAEKKERRKKNDEEKSSNKPTESNERSMWTDQGHAEWNEFGKKHASM